MDQLSLKQLAQALRHKECSSVELTQYFLARIQAHHDLNAFISVDEEQALIEARQADQYIQQGHDSLLMGIPMALKDLYCTRRMKTTCASKMLAGFQSPYDASLYEALKKQGAILVGKNNMDEFAMGSTNEHSYFGAVKNPWDKQCVSGGSSGGSAAAVAARLVPYAIGSDTGGSIRQPAAFCGISGIKPTYGLVSRYGMVAYASSLDQAGPLARSAEDLAIVLQAIVGHDPKDSTSADIKVPNYLQELQQPLHGVKIGLPTAFFHSQIEPEIQKAILDAVAVFTDLGAKIVEIDLKLHALWVPCYYVIACAEASSNLSRYDGLRFGHRSAQGSQVLDLIKKSRTEGFGAEVQRRILTGTHVLSAGYFDAYYLQAQKIRRMIQDELLQQLAQVDCILGPTTPTSAFRLGAQQDDPLQSYLADVFTVAANLAGLPALSIPAGFNHHLPVGLQLMGTHFSDNTLLRIAHQYQQNTHWHLSSPKN